LAEHSASRRGVFVRAASLLLGRANADPAAADSGQESILLLLAVEDKAAVHHTFEGRFSRKLCIDGTFRDVAPNKTPMTFVASAASSGTGGSDRAPSAMNNPRIARRMVASEDAHRPEPF